MAVQAALLIGRASFRARNHHMADNCSQVVSPGTSDVAPVILFDGTCAFCNFWSRFVLHHDRNRHFRLGRLQSNQGRKLCEDHGISPDTMDSVVLIDDGQAYLRSAAMIHILGYLPRPWCWLTVIRWLPQGLRDRLYDFVGRHRYQWFGRYDDCPMPDPQYRDRFIDAS